MTFVPWRLTTALNNFMMRIPVRKLQKSSQIIGMFRINKLYRLTQHVKQGALDILVWHGASCPYFMNGLNNACAVPFLHRTVADLLIVQYIQRVPSVCAFFMRRNMCLATEIGCTHRNWQ